MHRTLKFASALGLAVVATYAVSADEDRFFGSAMLQYTLFDEARPVKNDFGIDVALGIPVTDSFAVEIDYLMRSADGTAGVPLDQTGYGANGLFFFDRDGRMDPYFLLGVGRVSDELGLVEDDYTSFSAGIGVFNSITDNLTFRGDIRAYKGDNAGQTNDVAVSLGLVYYFGEAQQAVAEPAPMVVDGDADNDGVKDSADRCPGSAAGSTVDLAGCLVPVVVAAAAIDGDGDNDGVKDSADKCPTTPAGMPVDAMGCERDSDMDGVKDSADKCPDSPAGSKVLANGCPVPTTVKLEGVNFTSGTADFVAGATAKLDLAVQALKDNPTIAVEVAGHTDAQGDADANRALSQRRADAVRKYLIDGGVAAGQVSARGYGEDEPIASNDTAEGRAQNRRVELKVKQ